MTRGDVIQFARDNLNDGITTKDVRVIVNAAKEALKSMALKRHWAGYREWYRLNLKAPYSTGTVELASGTTVTGTGTTFESGMVDQLFQPNGENVVHEIETYSSGTSIALKYDYQTKDGTSITAGSSYKVYYYSYALPSTSGSPFITRRVEHVMTGDRARKLNLVSEGELRSLWASQPQAETPWNYSVVREISTSDATETQRLLLYPAPAETEVFDLVVDRWPSDFPASDSGIVDVPPYLEEYFKAALLYRLAQAHRGWAAKMQVALSNMSEHLKDAKREDARYAGRFSIGDGGMARNADYRRWTLTEYGS